MIHKPSTPLTDELYTYLLNTSLRDTPLYERLRTETQNMPAGGMQISPDQGQFMQLLVKLIGAKRTLEVGVFTGYSSLLVASALPDDGQIIACDVSDEWTSVARRYWQEAGVADKINLHLGPAADTLQALINDGQQGTFDFAFIDADKDNYDTYYEHALKLLRTGGLILIDNMLWHGAVVDQSQQDPDTVAIRALNEKLKTDERIDVSLVPIGDGVIMARKR